MAAGPTPGNADNEPAVVADKAGSQPAGTGGSFLVARACVSRSQSTGDDTILREPN